MKSRKSVLVLIGAGHGQHWASKVLFGATPMLHIVQPDAMNKKHTVSFMLSHGADDL